MVYRRKRALAAGVLREFRDGVITNAEYEKRWPRNKGDRALRAIYDQIELFSDDFSTYRLTGEHELIPLFRGLFDRCILYLESDLEYDWPPVKAGDITFRDVPASSVRSVQFRLISKIIFGITILLVLSLLGLAMVLAWGEFWAAIGIVYVLGLFVYEEVLSIKRRIRPGPRVQAEVLPAVKYRAGKEWWPFRSREEMAGCEAGR